MAITPARARSSRLRLALASALLSGVVLGVAPSIAAASPTTEVSGASDFVSSHRHQANHNDHYSLADRERDRREYRRDIEREFRQHDRRLERTLDRQERLNRRAQEMPAPAPQAVSPFVIDARLLPLLPWTGGSIG